MSEQQSVLRSSAVMAAGTVVSRFSGFIRSALLAAALGNALHAEVFTIANTIPNMIYILLAGGVINAVLVPQLVRSLKHDLDGGEAYTNRVLTLIAAFLGVVTILLIIFAPAVMRIFVSAEWPDEAFDSTVMFARLCLPQVFFYGMFVLVGQVLNARGRFGPMMWAPIANNIVSVAMLVMYLVVFGADDPLSGEYSTGRELLLGLGSTVGIAIQLLVLVPFLRAAGVTFKPRWDFRDAGLAHTLRLGMWTVLFVIVNQVAYSITVRLASAGTVADAENGTGYTVYSTVFLIIMVPHSIITVSLATAILPRLSGHAAAKDNRAAARVLAPTLRNALTVVVPFAALLPFVATPMSHVLWGYGAAADSVSSYVPTLALFGPGLIFFTIHYLVLRGFYAREETKLVFYIQCAVAATNIVAALVFVHFATPAQTAPALVLAYTTSYAVGSVISYRVLSRRLGGLHTPLFVRFLVRLVIAAGLAALVTWALVSVVPWLWSDGNVLSSLIKGGLTGAAMLVIFLFVARSLRLTEVSTLVSTLTRRIRR